MNPIVTALVSLAAAGLSIVAVSARPAVDFMTVDLGTLGGTESGAVAVNAHGQVVGYSTLPGDTETHVFSWTETGGMVDIGFGDNSRVWGMNDKGQVVGSSYLAGPFSHAVVWSEKDGLIDLGTLAGNFSSASDINDRGVVVGVSELPQPDASAAFLWTERRGMTSLGDFFALAVNAHGQITGYRDVGFIPGTPVPVSHAVSWTEATGMVELGTAGFVRSFPVALNNRGWIVGYLDNGPPFVGGIHPFLWTEAGGMVDLGTLGGEGFARDVNDRGQIVGTSRTASFNFHAFSWTESSGMLDLGVGGGDSSDAADVNEKGEVVGHLAFVQGPAQRGFFWSDAAGMVELDTLGGSFGSASAINDRGLIVGRSSLAGDAESHATLWVPTRRSSR